MKHLIAKNGLWRCRKCHGLVNRTSLIRHNARLTEKVDRLEAEVGSGRPRGMHNPTYQRLKAQLSDSRARLGDDVLQADSRFGKVITTHIAGHSKRKIVKELRSTPYTSKPVLFEKRLISLLNDHFVAKTEDVVNRVPKSLWSTSDAFFAEGIVRLAPLRPLVLADADELVERTAVSCEPRTIVELRYLGDERLLFAHSERGKPLPPCSGELDTDAGIIRFTFPGAVDKDPVVRVLIDDQVAVLHE